MFTVRVYVILYDGKWLITWRMPSLPLVATYEKPRSTMFKIFAGLTGGVLLHDDNFTGLEFYQP